MARIRQWGPRAVSQLECDRSPLFPSDIEDSPPIIYSRTKETNGTDIIGLELNSAAKCFDNAKCAKDCEHTVRYRSKRTAPLNWFADLIRQSENEQERSDDNPSPKRHRVAKNISPR
jgi:hypothetical protein